MARSLVALLLLGARQGASADFLASSRQDALGGELVQLAVVTEVVHPPYIYEPEDTSKRLEVHSEPRVGSPLVTNDGPPAGKVMLTTEKKVGPDGNVFLHIPTYKGWILAQKKGGEGSQEVRPLLLPEWRCQPAADDKSIDVLDEPGGAAVAGQHLEPGKKFLAIEQVVGKDGILYVKPVFGAGFVASTHCEYLPSELWRYDPEVTDAPVKPLPILSEPHLAADPTGVHLPVPCSFYVESKHVGEHQTLFLQPRGEAGYVYDKSPEQKHARVVKVGAPSRWVYKPSGSKKLKVMPYLERVEDAWHAVLPVEISPNTMFEVSGQETGPDGIKYHELADGRGFVPVKDTVAFAPVGAAPAPAQPSMMALIIGAAVAVIVAIVLFILCVPRNKADGRRTFEVRAPPPQIKGSRPQTGFAPVTPPPAAKAAPKPAEPAKPPAEPTMSMWFQDKGAKDENGIREYRFTHRPLGLQFKLRAPIIINGYTPDGTGRDLGVKMGSTLVAIGGGHEGEVFGTKTDVRGKNYEEIWDLLKTGCAQIPARDGVIDYMGSVKKKPRSRTNSPNPDSRDNTR